MWNLSLSIWSVIIIILVIIIFKVLSKNSIDEIRGIIENCNDELNIDNKNVNNIQVNEGFNGINNILVGKSRIANTQFNESDTDKRYKKIKNKGIRKKKKYRKTILSDSHYNTTGDNDNSYHTNDDDKPDKHYNTNDDISDDDTSDNDNIDDDIKQKFMQRRNKKLATPIPMYQKKESEGEKYCRDILEEIFSVPFPSVRPKFLKNPLTNRSLEFDCYNHKLRLALEYNGYQHYTFPNVYHKSETAFRAQLKRDEIKKDICDKLGITLIIVPHTVQISDLKSYIVNKLIIAGYIQKS